MRGLVVAALVGLVALAVGAWLVLGDEGRLGSPAEAAAAPARQTGTAGRQEEPLFQGMDPARAPAVEATPDGRTELVATPDPAQDAATAADGVTLEGRVVDAAGRPLADARVYLAPEQGWPGPPLDSRSYDTGSWGGREQTRTDERGRFGFEGVERGRVRLAVRAAGFAPLDLGGVQVGAAQRQALGDLELVPGAILSGTVVDPHGAPVAGAELVRPDPSGLFLFHLDSGNRGALLATSAADGSFRIETLASGPWQLLVTTPDHPDLLVEGATEHAGREVAGLVLRLAPGYAISGRVEAPEGTDWSGLRVRATRPGRVEVDATSGLVPWRESACAADGSFTVAGLAEQGTHVLRVWEGAPGSGRGRTLSEPVEASTGAHDVVLTLAEPVEITFRAVDAATDRLLEDFSVELLVERGASTASEVIESGDERRTRVDEGTTAVRFTPRGDAAARTRVRLSAAGYRAWTSEPLELDGGRGVDLGRVELEPMPVLLVRVVAAADGAPIEGATVTLRRDEAREGAPSPDPAPPHGREESARTDAGGRARVALVPGRFALLGTSKEGFAPGEPLPVRVDELPPPSDEPAFELRLARGGAVEVRVVDGTGAAAPGTEVSGTLVDASGHSATQTTDAAGLALFEHLPVGAHRFEVAAPRRPGLILDFGAGEHERGDPRSHGEVVVTEGGHAQLTLVRPAQGRLRGRITEGGRPLAGAGLRLDQTGAPGFVIPGLTDQPWTHTDGAGRYVVEPLKAGRYELVIQHRTRVMDARVELTVVEGENTLDVELPPTGIEGRVSDASGRPVEGAEVRVRTVVGGGGGGSVSVMVGAFGSDGDDSISMRFGGEAAPAARSGPDGLYRLRGVRADVDLVVTATHPGHRTTEREVPRLAPGDLRTEVDLELGPAGRVEVVVLGAAGQPVAQLSVVARWKGDEEQQFEDVGGHTDAGGTAVLTGLAPGPWEVTAQPGGWSEEDLARIQPRALTVVAGETQHVVLELP